MSKLPIKTEARKPRRIEVRACNDRRYETIEAVIEHNGSQSSVVALTRAEAVTLIARLVAHLEESAPDGALVVMKAQLEGRINR